MINDLGVHPEKCDLGVRLKLAKVGPDRRIPTYQTYWDAPSPSAFVPALYMQACYPANLRLDCEHKR